jgi:hypothetical protein
MRASITGHEIPGGAPTPAAGIGAAPTPKVNAPVTGWPSSARTLQSTL